MNDRHYHNYYREHRGEETYEESSFLFMLRRRLYRGYAEFNKAVRNAVKRCGNFLFYHRLLDMRVPRAYRAAVKEPIDENKVVFVEVRHPQITNSFKVMFDELVNNYDYNVHTHFLLNNNTLRMDYEKRVINAVEDIATAKYVFVDEASNALSAMPLREGTKIIQLWHGCGAFKKFGFSTADLIFGADRKEQTRHPFYKNYSLVTISSPEVDWAYREAMNITEESGIIQPLGISRTDVFYDDNFKALSFEHLYEICPQARGKKVILYAPTFRGRVARAKTPDRLNIAMFYEAFGEDYVLLFKHHPLVRKRPVIDEKFRDFAFDVTDTLSIEDLICTSDFCISDYSSLIFEYSLFERPLIFFAYDLDEYFDWRGFYYDYDEMAPGPICKTNLEMIDYIKNIDTRFDKKAVQDFKYKFMRSCDGNATRRILEYAFDDLEKHRKNCEHFEHYYDVPRVESNSMPYFRLVKMIGEEKEYASNVYANECRKPVEKGAIVAFDIRCKEIRTMLESSKNTHLVFAGSGDTFDEVIRKLARANYILIDQNNPFIDSLEIRPETKVVLLPSNAFPLEAFGIHTKEFRSGLRREQYEIAPLYKNVNAVVCSSAETAKIFTDAIGNNVEALITGDVRSDVFYNEKYRSRLLAKLYQVCPKLEGKKIIAFHANDDSMFDDSMIYEYLSRDYAFLERFETVREELLTNEEALEQNYASDSIVDVSLIFSDYDLNVMADIIVGGFSSSVYSAMASGKPVIIYSADAKLELAKAETFVDIPESSPTAIFTDLDDVVSAIRNIDGYDYGRYNALREKYLEKCDGKCTKRLLKKLL